MLISRGADVNLESNGVAPLERAISFRMTSTVQHLVRAGADIFRPSKVGRPPCAVRQRHSFFEGSKGKMAALFGEDPRGLLLHS
jgi:hypothetical protein